MFDFDLFTKKVSRNLRESKRYSLLLNEVKLTATNIMRFKLAYGTDNEIPEIEDIFTRFTRSVDRLQNKDIFSYGSIEALRQAIGLNSLSRADRIKNTIEGIKRRDPSFGYIGEDKVSIIVCPQTATNTNGVTGKDFSFQFFGGGKDTGRISLLTGQRARGSTWCTAADGSTHYDEYTTDPKHKSTLLYFIKKASDELGAIRFTTKADKGYGIVTFEQIVKHVQHQREENMKRLTPKELKRNKNINPEQWAAYYTLTSLLSIMTHGVLQECRNMNNYELEFIHFLKKYTDLKIKVEYSQLPPSEIYNMHNLILEWIKKYIYNEQV